MTRAYILAIGQPAAAELQSQVQKLITASLPDEQWGGRLPTGDPVLLTVLPDRIVLRHKSSVHEKVEALLKDSGVATPPPTGMAGRGGGLGGSGGFGGGRTRGVSGSGFFHPGPAK